MRKVTIQKFLFIGLGLLGFAVVCLLVISFLRPDHQPFQPNDLPHDQAGQAERISLPEPSPYSDAHVINADVATTGCGSTNQVPTGTSSVISVTSSQQRRSYRLYLPPDYTNNTPHSLVLSFHGYEADDLFQETVSGFDATARANNVIVAYPEGLPNMQHYRGWDTGLHPGINANDTLYVSNVLNQIQSNFCIQSKQIYATGFSNGGGFVNLLACRMAGRFAAFAPVSGSYVTPIQSCKPDRPVSMLEIHGTADNVNPVSGSVRKREPPLATWLASWVHNDVCNPMPTITPLGDQVKLTSWSGCEAGSSVMQYSINGERHDWPSVAFKRTIDGKPQYFDAANTIWHFFSQHSLKTT